MKTTFFKALKTILLVGAAVLLASCSDLDLHDAASNNGGKKTIVTFDFSTASRTALPSVNLTSYKYKVHYKLSTESAYTVSSAFDADSAIALSLPAGTYDFEVIAYATTDTDFSSPILTGSVTAKEISASSSTVSVVLKAATGGTGSVKITLKVATSLGAAKICADLYDEIPEEAPVYDATKALTIDTETNAGYQTVTYANASVDSGVSKYVAFFLYDSSDAYIMPYADSVYVVPGLESVDSHTLNYAKADEPEPSEPEEPSDPTKDLVLYTSSESGGTKFTTDNYNINLSFDSVKDLTGYKYLNIEFSCPVLATNLQVVLQPFSGQYATGHQQGNIVAETALTTKTVMQTKFGTTFGKYTDYSVTPNVEKTITDNYFGSVQIFAQDSKNNWLPVNGIEVYITKITATNTELDSSGTGTGSTDPGTPLADRILYTSSNSAGTEVTTSDYTANITLDAVVDLTGYKYINIEFYCPDLDSGMDRQLVLQPNSGTNLGGHQQGDIVTQDAITSKTVMQTAFGTTFGKYKDYSVTPPTEITITDNDFGSVQIFTQESTNWSSVDGVKVYVTQITATNTALNSSGGGNSGDTPFVSETAITATGSTNGTSTGTATKEFTASSPNDSSSFTTLVWADEFEGTALKTENWQYEVVAKGASYNDELQEYTGASADNVAVRDGCLVLTAKDDLTSGRINSQDKKYFTYGKLTARIKMSNGYGSWPAFWLLGNNNDTKEGDKTISWPGCGEIDIMEHNNSDSFIYNTLHWNKFGYDWQWEANVDPHVSSGETITSTTPEVTFIDVSEWHTYTCEWTSSCIKMYVDDVQTFEMTIPATTTGLEAFHKPFYVIFNFAMGGAMPQVYDENNFTNLPWQMYVDYIRLYQ